uniref:Uncharacterized protein n=1 Tax=Micrurus spixii TaxID=129469 RepID=A0A2D4MGR0_9SAUR
MVWMSRGINTDIKEVDIEPSLWANHNPIKYSWRGCKKIARWTIQHVILKEKEFKSRMEKELGLFLSENREQKTSIRNLWDTAKAYMRGVAIVYMVKKNKEKKYQQKKLEEHR